MSSPAAPLPRPDPWVQEALPALLAAPAGKVLDLACGDGRNSLFLGRLGISTLGVDNDPSQIEEARRAAAALGIAVEFTVREVAGGTLPPGPWSGICVCHFLDRELFTELAERLRPGGILVYKTHLQHALRPPGMRPLNSAYLLRAGELLQAFPALQPLLYREWAATSGAFAGLVALRPYPS